MGVRWQGLGTHRLAKPIPTAPPLICHPQDPPHPCSRSSLIPPPPSVASPRDLLADGAARSPDAGRITDANAIKHDASGGHTTVAGASRVPVGGAGHAAELVKRAAEARACAETAMNSTSSRSHVVIMLYIDGVHAASGTRLAGCLCLVDLAGRWVGWLRACACACMRGHVCICLCVRFVYALCVRG